MDNLTDLEIQVEVAKIHLGSKYDIHKNEGMGTVGYLPVDCIGKLTPFNPLTDDALCFQLLKKYNIDLISPYFPNNDTKYEAQIFINGIADALSEYDENANKAILLAIIEAHKES